MADDDGFREFVDLRYGDLLRIAYLLTGRARRRGLSRLSRVTGVLYQSRRPVDCSTPLEGLWTNASHVAEAIELIRTAVRGDAGR